LEYDYDCLDFYPNDRISPHNDISRSQYQRDHQIIPFCRCDNIDDGLIMPGIDIPIFTFKELNERNVTSFDLYTWSASIDLVEHYQAYRERQIDDKIQELISLLLNYSLKISQFIFFFILLLFTHTLPLIIYFSPKNRVRMNVYQHLRRFQLIVYRLPFIGTRNSIFSLPKINAICTY